jgi:hypothetical protein
LMLVKEISVPGDNGSWMSSSSSTGPVADPSPLVLLPLPKLGAPVVKWLPPEPVRTGCFSRNFGRQSEFGWQKNTSSRSLLADEITRKCCRRCDLDTRTAPT